MRILQLRNDLKTLANTKTASQLYKYFWEVDLLLQALALYPSTSFLEL